MKTLIKQKILSEKQRMNWLMISLEWCAKYTDIQQALRQTRKELYPAATKSTEGDRLPGSTKINPPPKSSPPKAAKDTLLNAIQESFPNQSK